jgi:isocitrate dehydrogenase
MKTERSVGGIMSPLQMVGGASKVDSAMHVMREHGLNAILVEPNADGEWGIMTKRDVLRKIIVPNRRPGGMTVDEILADFAELTRDDIRACLAFAADRERKLVVA